MDTDLTPDQDTIRIEAIRIESLTQELLKSGFRPSIIQILIIFDYEHLGTLDDRHPDCHLFRIRNNINTPIVIQLNSDANMRDLHDAILQAGRNNLRTELATAYQTLSRWLGLPPKH